MDTLRLGKHLISTAANGLSPDRKTEFDKIVKYDNIFL